MTHQIIHKRITKKGKVIFAGLRQIDGRAVYGRKINAWRNGRQLTENEYYGGMTVKQVKNMLTKEHEREVRGRIRGVQWKRTNKRNRKRIANTSITDLWKEIGYKPGGI